ncbi:MAG TPA: Uma2 family endonuclease [Thermoanaerobaculia bacterium]|nr:Uma2 family endonuclease [Thermoanaerobaculia bacterium]
MNVETRVYTAEELLAMPRKPGYELVEGELRAMSPSGFRHGTIISRIDGHLRAHVDAHLLGEVTSGEAGFVLARQPDTIRAPDVGFVRAERVTETTGFFPGPPDLAIEVISPSDRENDVAAKTLEYLRAGTRAVVLIDPETRAVAVHRTSGVTQIANILTVDEVVPGWSLPLADLFTTVR